ncbi:MAG TPA: FIST N-terminal domain-containing protein [Polyangiaceae bacterium]|nr:FIST N-terminal domain-containing protein [Polyangiaceae bacterium]
MAKATATGASFRKDVARAGEEAARDALSRLGTRRPTFGFVFASPDHDLGIALGEVRRVTGCNDLLGCSTAGALTEAGPIADGVAVMLVASSDSSHRMDFGRGLRSAYGPLARQFNQSASEAKKPARLAGRRHLTTVLLTDGLAGTGEQLVHEMFESSQSSSQIVGGAAGDDGRFLRTMVGAGRECSEDAAAALHVFDSKPWGVGVNHGLRPTTKPLRVTRSRGNVIHTIEGEPAFDMYRRHAAESGVTLTRDNAPAYLVANELGVHFFDTLARARAPLAVGADGSLTCAAPVPEGSFVSILDGVPEIMIEAAKSAAVEARQRLGEGRAAGVLLFDCICRGMILKHALRDEIDAVRSVFGDVPVAGFLTYGEIARYGGRLDGWHNATAVVVAVPA